MPLIIREDSKKLNKKEVIIPDEVAKKLYQNMNIYANDKTSDGYKRLRSLTNKDYNRRSDAKDKQHNNKMTVSFADARRIAHDMKHMPQNGTDKEFNMLGGFETYQAVKNGLKQARNSIKQNNPVPPVPKLDKSPTKVPEVKNDEIKMGNAMVTVKEITITDKQAMMLKEYHNELNIPFNHPDQAYDPKLNYQHLIDFFEEIGHYGTLPNSTNQYRDKNFVPYEIISDIFDRNVNYLDEIDNTDFVRDFMYYFLNDNIENKDLFKDYELAQECLKNYCDDFYTISDFKKNLLTDYGISVVDKEFKNDAMEHIIDDMKLTTDSRGLIYVERAITIPNAISDRYEYNNHFNGTNYGDYYDRLINNYDGLGNSWSYLPGGSDAYLGEHFKNGTTTVVIKGYVDMKSVNWAYSVELGLANDNEYELFIKTGEPIEVFEIKIENCSNSDINGKKLPLKSPIIINA